MEVTRKGWSERKDVFGTSGNLEYPSSGCESRPAKAKTRRPEASLATALVDYEAWDMMNQTKHNHERMCECAESKAAGIFGAALPSHFIAFGHFRLRAAERLLERDGVRLKLGSRALDILIALVERAPQVVGKRELLARVWPGVVVDEGSLRFHIAALRKVLGDGQSGVRYVINVAGRGYCFAAPILRPDSKPSPAESLRTERIAPRPHHRHDGEAIAALPGAIAHEFNNIIGAILGYGELAQNAASADDSMRCYVDNIMIAGRRAKSLVERLLAFIRGGTGDRVPVHAQSVVAEALALISGTLPAGMRLEGELHAGDAAIMGDPTQIHRVVMNLCTNALQAMKSGGALMVSLDLLTLREPGTFATATLCPGEYIRLLVRDSGIGIVPEVLERIFEPFFTTKEVGAGTGLGLSFVHCVVSDLGGAVDVESEPGRGSAFTVLLPRHGRASQTSPAVEELPRGTDQTILLKAGVGPTVAPIRSALCRDRRIVRCR